MLATFGRLSWVQRGALGLGLLTAATLAVLEGFSSETLAPGIGLAICGLVQVAVLAMPTLRPVVIVEATCVSIAFTLLTPALPQGLDNTYGLVETIALACLVTRVIIELPPRRSALLVPLQFLAIVIMPLRCYTIESGLREVFVILTSFATILVIVLGLYLRLHDQRRADGHEMAKQVQRLTYARDLHDFVAHHVTAIVAQAQAVRYTTAAGQQPTPEALDKMLAGIEKAGSQALASMRGMITVLRDDQPIPVRKPLGAVLSEATGQFVGPPVTTEIDEVLAETYLVPHVLDAVHHVVQESLTNVLRHAEGTTGVTVSARTLPDDKLEIVVRDDGAAKPGSSGGGFGLVGLRERVEAAGGTLTSGPDGDGWRVAATLPLTLALPS
ncbi:Signal transduction histidine kinase [Amycolatopsis xylanica]|uniref:histidine kinase n=1 Tax=Amycolatopsis xylanica TaxID=589385 RepID=A0A1H3RL30_9PSEU|nr:histidine kinase [Amycolatopsis xylanica]SDZ26452.1 Signal transduction histidine kinase [Amycolatopsis xylanica]